MAPDELVFVGLVSVRRVPQMNAHRVGRRELAGSIEVGGCIFNAGIRAGSVHDHGGTISDVDGGRVKHPDRVEGGEEIYRW